MSELTPMLVQYLVGLCCLQSNPDAVDVTIGDMVLDSAAGKARDVDVTVTVGEPGAPSHAFKAYEVKHEAAPLDVSVVEGLCLKLADMPAVNYRAIASTSGFTDGARSKAASHGVTLLQLKPWTKRIEEQFPVLGMRGTIDECFPGSTALLFWIDDQLALVASTAPASFSVADQDALFAADGTVHRKYPTFRDYRRALLLRSTQILYALEPATTVLRSFPIPPVPSPGSPHGPRWPHTHTLDARPDGAFIRIRDELHALEAVTISGFLQWQRGQQPQHHILEDVSDGTAFAGAVIALGPTEGKMTALIFDPVRSAIGVRFVELAEKHRNAIRNLKLSNPRD